MALQLNLEPILQEIQAPLDPPDSLRPILSQMQYLTHALDQERKNINYIFNTHESILQLFQSLIDNLTLRSPEWPWLYPIRQYILKLETRFPFWKTVLATSRDPYLSSSLCLRCYTKV